MGNEKERDMIVLVLLVAGAQKSFVLVPCRGACLDTL